jgi:hypothetical protein
VINEREADDRLIPKGLPSERTRIVGPSKRHSTLLLANFLVCDWHHVPADRPYSNNP